MAANTENRRGADISRRESIGRNVESNLSRIRTRLRNPEGGWDWLGKKRMGLKSMGRHIENREMYMYLKDCRIAESRKLRDVIERHFISLEFSAELKDPDAEKFQEKFPNCLMAIGGI